MWLHPHKTQRESCESNNTKQCESCKSKNADTVWIMGYPKTQNITWNLWIQKHKHSVNHVDPKHKKIKVNHVNSKTQNIMWIMWIQKHKTQCESCESKRTKHNVNHVNPTGQKNVKYVNEIAQTTAWIMWISLRFSLRTFQTKSRKEQDLKFLCNVGCVCANGLICFSRLFVLLGYNFPFYIFLALNRRSRQNTSSIDVSATLWAIYQMHLSRNQVLYYGTSQRMSEYRIFIIKLCK